MMLSVQQARAERASLEQISLYYGAHMEILKNNYADILHFAEL